MKHIVHLVQGLEVGGLERVAVVLATAMVQRGYRLSIVCYDSMGPLAEEARNNNIFVELLPRRPGIDLGYIWRLAMGLRRLAPDVLHMHSDTAMFYGTLAAMVAKVRTRICTEHDGVFPRSRRVRMANRFLLKHLTQAVAVSGTVKELWCQEDGIDRSRVLVVPNGVPDIFTARPAREEGGSGSLTFGYLGRLSPEKGVDVLIEAFARACDRLARARLAIVGDGTERSSLEAMARMLGIQTRVDFLGVRHDVATMLAGMDVFVLPSRREGLPMAILEAMSMGLPVIATAVGGVPEAICDGVNGLLAPPDDPSAIADAMVRIALDAPLRQSLSKQSRQVFLERYELTQMVNTYEQLMAI